MTDREVALVLPAETDIKLLADDVEAARGYAEHSLCQINSGTWVQWKIVPALTEHW